MKKMIRLSSVGVVGALATALAMAPAQAGSSNYTSSGWNSYSSSVIETWFVNTPASTSISADVSVTIWDGYAQGWATSFTEDDTGAMVFQVAAGGWGYATYTDSDSTSGLTPCTFELHHVYGGTVGQVSASISTTFSW